MNPQDWQEEEEEEEEELEDSDNEYNLRMFGISRALPVGGGPLPEGDVDWTAGGALGVVHAWAGSCCVLPHQPHGCRMDPPRTHAGRDSAASGVLCMGRARAYMLHSLNRRTCTWGCLRTCCIMLHGRCSQWFHIWMVQPVVRSWLVTDAQLLCATAACRG